MAVKEIKILIFKYEIRRRKNKNLFCTHETSVIQFNVNHVFRAEIYRNLKIYINKKSHERILNVSNKFLKIVKFCMKILNFPFNFSMNFPKFMSTFHCAMNV